MKFGLITYILHKEHKEKFYSYEPYVREMNIWLKFTTKFLLLAPKKVVIPDPVERAYTIAPSEFHKIPQTSFITFKETFNAIICLPYICLRIFNVMHRADHIHLRCPGNVGVLGCFVQVFFPKKPKTAKYAGNWDPKADQPWTYKLQKRILQNTFLTRNMQVLVYGDWNGQTKNIKPFFTASFAEQEISAVREKDFDGRLTFLFVGNLVSGKHPLRAIQLVQEIQSQMELDQEAPQISLEIYGDGPERNMLEAFCRDEKLKELVTFKGSSPLEDLKQAYQKAHFVVLPSQSEGWPKAIAEGMFFGCIPIATPVSCVPWMLDYGKRGVLLEEIGRNLVAKNQQPEKRGQRTGGRGQRPNTDVEVSDAKKIVNLLEDTEEMQRKSQAAKNWSQQYTLEKFEAAIQDVLNK